MAPSVTQVLGKEKKRWGPVEALVHFKYDPVTEDEALTAESRAVLLHSFPVSMSSIHATSPEDAIWCTVANQAVE